MGDGMADDTSIERRRKRVAQQQIDHIGVNLWQASNAFIQEMLRQVRACGFDDVTVADAEFLPHLAISGSSLTQLALKRRTSRQAVHQSAHSLMKRGYLSLETDPADRRAKLVRYTERGLDFVEALQAIKAGLQKQAETKIGKPELGTLTEMLDELAALYDREP